MISISNTFDSLTRIRELVNNLRYLSNFESNAAIEINKIDAVTPLAVTPIASIINSKKFEYDFKGETSDYLRVIHFPDGVEEFKEADPASTFLPIIHLHLPASTPTERSAILSQLHSAFLKLLKQNVIADEAFINLITNNTFGFVISEMLDNIEQHAAASNVYIFGQYGHENNSCEVCLLDDGIGIFNSLQKAGRDVANHLDALQKVVEQQLSAKSEPGMIKRGTGIDNTRKALTGKEINGEFFLLSGNAAFLQVDNSQRKFLTLQNLIWQGTIVMMKLNKPTGTFNLYDYVS